MEIGEESLREKEFGEERYGIGGEKKNGNFYVRTKYLLTARREEIEFSCDILL